ncbi:MULTISPECIES: cell division protein FtsQ/DivIB [Clostridium]|uniref:FtsQ-type POTRA domain-containing protein n=3 Tax=Clostridium beijerinckii TaxID=1520 RepID=A0AAE2RUU3_CLOBE|nr:MULTISPECIES: FtsQ-type POTRA domain-containing protein [Clostridium]ABR33758.1 Polypeptide-transport-associated domain protein, FtsQ-type [Clostridium beijerinckii NCIMB 8052]AIU03166.1 polypeptide-transport-associated domain-containing protein [Clostridium beijerinckii ATCC 35702]ALB47134.1 FtsQ-type POTRA domain-containing protein [Clostridium beijerinckii NRRL B-598]AVK50596.1 peptidase S49 [Clostridium sp. MF28]MBF7812180.1 FtsQ-type POTRA domain-containing protein [Clostridium beijeri
MVKTNNNKLILRSQRRRLIRKIIMTIIVLFIVGTIFAIKSNFFIIKKVSILGNPVMSGEDVKNGTENLIGQNILFINKQNIISNAKKNPYVENVEISKSYPKQVNIKISEKEGIYYVEKDGYKYVLDNDGNLLEKTDSVENRSLVNVKGIDLKDVALGQKMIDDSRVLDFLDIFYQIIKINPTNYKIDYVDISDFTNIKVYVGEVEGRLGNDENIPDKMNKLLHIIQNPDIGIVKGYVDVGFNGAPVYYKEER